MSIRLDQNQFHSRHSEAILAESSLLRPLANKVMTVFCGFWRSLASYFGKIEIQNVSISSTKTENYPYLSKGISQLCNTWAVGPEAVQTFCEILQAKHQDKIQLVPNFMYQYMSPQLPQSEGKPLILVPVVMKGFPIDHIVAVVYDRLNNRVELFDSKGLTSRDSTDPVRSAAKEEIHLEDVLRLVVDTYGDENSTIIENSTQHQYDIHNCGIYVMDYFERRVVGQSHEAIVASPLTYKCANQDRRVQIIRTLTI